MICAHMYHFALLPIGEVEEDQNYITENAQSQGCNCPASVAECGDRARI